MEQCVVEHKMRSLLNLSRITYSPHTTTKSADPLEYTQEQSEDCLQMVCWFPLRSLLLQNSYSPPHLKGYTISGAEGGT